MKQLLVAGFAVIAYTVSFLIDRKKTGQALKVAGRRLSTMLPAFLTMLVAVAVVLSVFPEERIVAFLGDEGLFLSTLGAAVVGSIALMPGFVAFPLAGILLSRGVAYLVLSMFTTTLMMVGILTFPIERRYFGVGVAVVRNAISLAVALLVALATGWYFGEIG